MNPTKVCEASLLTLALCLSTTHSALAGQPEPCIQTIAPLAAIGRSELEQFINLYQPTDKGRVQQVLGVPYCKLQTLPSGIQRDAYPLKFDPETWLIVHYRYGYYNSYDFTFHNR